MKGVRLSERKGCEDMRNAFSLQGRSKLKKFFYIINFWKIIDSYGTEFRGYIQKRIH